MGQPMGAEADGPGMEPRTKVNRESESFRRKRTVMLESPWNLPHTASNVSFLCGHLLFPGSYPPLES